MAARIWLLDRPGIRVAVAIFRVLRNPRLLVIIISYIYIFFLTRRIYSNRGLNYFNGLPSLSACVFPMRLFLNFQIRFGNIEIRYVGMLIVSPSREIGRQSIFRTSSGFRHWKYSQNVRKTTRRFYVRRTNPTNDVRKIKFCRILDIFRTSHPAIGIGEKCQNFFSHDITKSRGTMGPRTI